MIHKEYSSCEYKRGNKKSQGKKIQQHWINKL